MKIPFEHWRGFFSPLLHSGLRVEPMSRGGVTGREGPALFNHAAPLGEDGK